MVTVDDADAFPTLAGGFGVAVAEAAAPRLPRLVWRPTRFRRDEDEDEVEDFPSPAPSAAAAFIGAGMYRTSPAAFSTRTANSTPPRAVVRGSRRSPRRTTGSVDRASRR